MSTLEQEAASTFGRWLENPDEPLARPGISNVTRWLAKTALVLAFSESDARRFLETPTETAIPDITTARKLAEGKTPKNVQIGAARTDGDDVLWLVGNPTVLPTGPNRISSRAVNVAALNLGRLQLWTDQASSRGAESNNGCECEHGLYVWVGCPPDQPWLGCARGRPVTRA